jgi:hypothetical protein
MGCHRLGRNRYGLLRARSGYRHGANRGQGRSTTCDERQAAQAKYIDEEEQFPCHSDLDYEKVPVRRI